MSEATTCHCDVCGAAQVTQDYRLPAGWKEILPGRHMCGNCIEEGRLFTPGSRPPRPPRRN